MLDDLPEALLTDGIGILERSGDGTRLGEAVQSALAALEALKRADLGEAVFHDCLPSFVDEGPAPVRSGARTGNCAPAEAEILPPEVCIGTAPTDGGGLIGKSSETESPVTVHPFVQTFLRVEMSQPSPNEF